MYFKESNVCSEYPCFWLKPPPEGCARFYFHEKKLKRETRIPEFFKYEFKGEKMDALFSIAIQTNERVVLKNVMLNLATKWYNKIDEMGKRKLLRARKIIHIIIKKSMERIHINDSWKSDDNEMNYGKKKFMHVNF